VKKSQEARIRAFASDLLAIVDRRDGLALKQAAALAIIPTARPKPAAPAMSLARAVALGKIVVPELGNFTERERVIEHRMHMRERLANRSFTTGFTEFDFENAAFKKEEETRIAAATAALKQGHAPGHVAAHFHLTESEVAQMLDQLAGRAPAAEQD
jgi:hypothetical protein